MGYETPFANSFSKIQTYCPLANSENILNEVCQSSQLKVKLLRARSCSFPTSISLQLRFANFTANNLVGGWVRENAVLFIKPCKPYHLQILVLQEQTCPRHTQIDLLLLLLIVFGMNDCPYSP